MSQPTRYQQEAERLAESSDARAQQLLAAYETGRISEAEFASAAATTTAGYNQRAALLGSVGLAAVLMLRGADRSTVTDLPPAPRDATADVDRLKSSYRTVIDDPVPSVAEDDRPASRSARTRRVAHSEPLEAAYAARTHTLRDAADAGLVTGWRRQLDAQPCERCRRWAREDRVQPVDKRFRRHNGCGCVQEPVIARRDAED